MRQCGNELGVGRWKCEDGISIQICSFLTNALDVTICVYVSARVGFEE